MKKLLITLLILLAYTAGAAAAPLDSNAIGQQLLDTLSTDNVNQFISKINSELNEDIPLLNGDILKDIAGKGLTFNWQTVWQTFIARLFRELSTNLHLMGKLVFLAVLCALLQNLQNSFEHSGISLLAYSLCYIFLVVIVLNAMFGALTLASQTVANMVGFMEALLPLLISLLAGVGALTSASLFTPLMLFVVNTISVVVKDAVLPLLFLTAVLECVNNLSDKYHLSNLSGLFKQAGMVVLGFAMVAFIGMITIQGVTGSVADGVTLRTAKFATATFIPVVGKMLADTVEVVMGASLLLKNAIGIFGVVAIFMICAFPVIKLLALILVIKIAGALVQPMGDEKMAKCLDAMGNNLLLIFGAVITVAVMFFLAITMIIGVGSAAMMLR